MPKSTTFFLAVEGGDSSKNDVEFDDEYCLNFHNRVNWSFDFFSKQKHKQSADLCSRRWSCVGQQPAKVANTANSFYLRERLTLFKKFFGLIIRGNHTLGILFGQEMFITSSNKAKTYCTKDFGCFSSWRKCLQCWWATSRGRLSLFFVTWKESKHLTICQTGSAT